MTTAQFLGAMVVKLEFPELEREWRQGSDTLLVSDARGIIFIANQPGWRYRLLEPLNDSDHAELKATRQYDKQPLTPLDYQSLRRFDDNSDLTRVDGPDGNADYLWESLPLAAEGWTLHLLRRPQVAFEDQSQRRAGRCRVVAGAGVSAAVSQPALASGENAPAQPRRTRTTGRRAHPRPAHRPGRPGAIGQTRRPRARCPPRSPMKSTSR